MDFLDRFSKKCTKQKFHDNLSSGGRDAPSGQTYGQTDTTNIIVVFLNYANAPNNALCTICRYPFNVTVDGMYSNHCVLKVWPPNPNCWFEVGISANMGLNNNILLVYNKIFCFDIRKVVGTCWIYVYLWNKLSASWEIQIWYVCDTL
jgi:hypothetical protein